MADKQNAFINSIESEYGALPHKFIGSMSGAEQMDRERQKERDGQSFTTKPGGTCDLCGTSIIDMYYFRGSNEEAKKYKCGSSCADKMLRATEDAGWTSNRQKYKNAKSKIAKVKRDARKAKNIAKGIEKLRNEHGPMLDALDALASDNIPKVSRIARSLHDSATKKGKLSDKQIELAKKLLSEL